MKRGIAVKFSDQDIPENEVEIEWYSDALFITCKYHNDTDDEARLIVVDKKDAKDIADFITTNAPKESEA